MKQDIPGTVRDGIYISHPRRAVFQAQLLDHSSYYNNRVSIPKDASSESSRRDVSDADLSGTGDTIPTVEIASMKNRPRGV